MTDQTESVFEDLERERLFNHATTGQRFVNFLIDTVILCNVFKFIAAAIIGVLLTLNGIDVESFPLFTDPVYSRLFEFGLGIVCVIGFYTLIEGSSKGKTLGKLITKTQALKEDGSQIGYKEAFRRSLGRIIPFEPLSGLSGNPWHDNLTRTIVVKK